MTPGTARLVVALVIGALAAADAVPAQPTGQARRIGVLAVVPGHTPRTEAFRQALSDLGYSEGKNVVVEWRWAAGRIERLPDLAADLVRLGVEVIVAGGPDSIVAAKKATSTIPIVMVAAPDPVGSGLVSSLARPGGNLTGLSFDATPELLGKQLELIKEMLPGLSRVAFLWDSAMPGVGPFVDVAKGAAQTLRLQLASVDIASDFDAALAAVVRERPGALFVMASSRSYVRRQQVIAFSAKHRLPAMYGFEEIAAAGDLMSYGPSLADLYRRAATYVDKILKGARPADLPVEQPTKFGLVVNLKTAKALGLTVPQSILVRADRAIE